jgi:hypothetical protein
MMLAGFGIALDLPVGWEGAVYRRPAATGETTNPVLHAANFALPPRRGDFGLGAVERMGPSDVLVVLFEYDADATRSALFSRQGRPLPQAPDFSPRKLQRTLAGQSGCQYFFSEGGRAFCLYVVLGSHAQRGRLVPAVASLLGRLALSPRAATW